jgi:hypothetical protein
MNQTLLNYLQTLSPLERKVYEELSWTWYDTTWIAKKLKTETIAYALPETVLTELNEILLGLRDWSWAFTQLETDWETLTLLILSSKPSLWEILFPKRYGIKRTKDKEFNQTLDKCILIAHFLMLGRLYPPLPKTTHLN